MRSNDITDVIPASGAADLCTEAAEAHDLAASGVNAAAIADLLRYASALKVRAIRWHLIFLGRAPGYHQPH